MTSEDVSRGRALEAQATAGPWRTYHFRSPRGAREYMAIGNDEGLMQVARDVSNEPTAELICYLRNHAQELFAASEERDRYSSRKRVSFEPPDPQAETLATLQAERAERDAHWQRNIEAVRNTLYAEQEAIHARAEAAEAEALRYREALAAHAIQCPQCHEAALSPQPAQKKDDDR